MNLYYDRINKTYLHYRDVGKETTLITLEDLMVDTSVEVLTETSTAMSTETSTEAVPLNKDNKNHI
jgi:hypothetical protein